MFMNYYLNTREQRGKQNNKGVENLFNYCKYKKKSRF